MRQQNMNRDFATTAHTLSEALPYMQRYAGAVVVVKFGGNAMGDDDAMLSLVTSANVAAGGHASDPDTMFATLSLAAARGVVVGAHPGYADREGFGRRVIPMRPDEIGRMVAAQTGALSALMSDLAPDVTLLVLPPMLEGDAGLAGLPLADTLLMVSDGTSTVPADLKDCDRLNEDGPPILGVVLVEAEA